MPRPGSALKDKRTLTAGGGKNHTPNLLTFFSCTVGHTISFFFNCGQGELRRTRFACVGQLWVKGVHTVTDHGATTILTPPAPQAAAPQPPTPPPPAEHYRHRRTPGTTGSSPTAPGNSSRRHRASATEGTTLGGLAGRAAGIGDFTESRRQVSVTLRLRPSQAPVAEREMQGAVRRFPTKFVASVVCRAHGHRVCICAEANVAGAMPQARRLQRRPSAPHP